MSDVYHDQDGFNEILITVFKHGNNTFIVVSIYHNWEPIIDLPQNVSDLHSDELDALAKVWKGQARRLSKQKSFTEFNKRLRRELAIETGILEKIYDIDRGTTATLIELGIEANLISFNSSDRPAEEIVPIIRDHETALEGLFDFVKENRKLSTSYIKELHQVLTSHQETVDALNGLGRRGKIKLRRGDWKKLSNNPTRPDGSIHEYCPPEQVASEMDRLIKYYLEHVSKAIPPEIEAAWLHHRFTQIHPFMDGNGRVARCLATLVCIRAGWFPLVIRRDHRANYIQSLEAADKGDLKPLIELFSDLQKGAFINALSLSREIKKTHLDILGAAARKIKKRLQEKKKRQAAVFNITKHLESIVLNRLKEVVKDAKIKMKDVNKFHAACHRSRKDDSHFYRWQIIQLAKELGYFADLNTYRSWYRLVLRIEKGITFELLISFHSLGMEFSGILACSAMTFSRELLNEGEGCNFVDLKRSSDKVFQFTYLEDPDIVESRLSNWIEEVIVVALDRWQKGL